MAAASRDGAGSCWRWAVGLVVGVVGGRGCWLDGAARAAGRRLVLPAAAAGRRRRRLRRGRPRSTAPGSSPCSSPASCSATSGSPTRWRDPRVPRAGGRPGRDHRVRRARPDGRPGIVPVADLAGRRRDRACCWCSSPGRWWSRCCCRRSRSDPRRAAVHQLGGHEGRGADPARLVRRDRRRRPFAADLRRRVRGRHGHGARPGAAADPGGEPARASRWKPWSRSRGASRGR